MIRGLKADGTAVLLSSHLLDQVQAVCDRVALFNDGKIVLEGTVPELAQQRAGRRLCRRDRGDRRRICRASSPRSPGAQRVTHRRAAANIRVVAERDIRAELARGDRRGRAAR